MIFIIDKLIRSFGIRLSNSVTKFVVFDFLYSFYLPKYQPPNNFIVEVTSSDKLHWQVSTINEKLRYGLIKINWLH